MNNGKEKCFIKKRKKKEEMTDCPLYFIITIFYTSEFFN